MATKNYLTKRDLDSNNKKLEKNFEEIFVTKNDLHNAVSRIFDKFDELVTKEEFEERIRLLPIRDEFLTWMDKLMGELKTIREEQIILSAHSSEQFNRIMALEKIHLGGRHLTTS
ncbi:hypothetical protein HYZ70_00965 [Candidatus Curtissbacteria bacterium]|nr:hypothetical protein [Candidatus Curtissbacteria bacterium]